MSFKERLFKQHVWWMMIIGILGILEIPGWHQLQEGYQDSRWPEVKLNSHDRILIMAPHPDDEVLGCGGIIQKAQRLELPIKVAFFTYGDNNEWSFIVTRKRPVFIPKAVQNMGMIRHDEAIAATQILGLTPEHLTFLGYPDFGTMTIWERYWGDSEPFRSMLTRVTRVPYSNAFRPGASYKGEEILQDLKSILIDFKPTKIFVSHPSDHNGDHRSLYLFTRVALWDLGKRVKAEVYPYLIHFKNWPRPRGFHPTEPLHVPTLLRKHIFWQRNQLEPWEISQKKKALMKHKSQFVSSRKYLESFVRTNELFGDFSVIKLQAQESLELAKTDQENYSQEVPEQLTGQDRTVFVGLLERYLYLQDGALVYTLQLSHPLAKEVELSFSLFGYRNDIAFGRMPKLQVRVGALRCHVSDAGQSLPDNIITILRKGKEVTIKVPLEVLGNPQRILFGAQTYFGEFPLDWLSWRVAELPAEVPGK
jgi:LmbE family N-acetylglucosaminyl deacetylase